MQEGYETTQKRKQNSTLTQRQHSGLGFFFVQTQELCNYYTRELRTTTIVMEDMEVEDNNDNMLLSWEYAFMF
jgi:hypothetical protein